MVSSGNVSDLQEVEVDKVCSFCNENFSCGVLKTAIEILEWESNKSSNEEFHEAFRIFRDKVSKYGYRYPTSDRYCELHGQRDLIQKLTTEASDLIDRFKKKSNV